jgi:hypothetical protein
VIAVAQESAVQPQAGPREARVLDQHGMHAQDFIIVSGFFPACSLASCRILWRPETGCRFELPFSAAVRHCGYTQETCLGDPRHL